MNIHQIETMLADHALWVKTDIGKPANFNGVDFTEHLNYLTNKKCFIGLNLNSASLEGANLSDFNLSGIRLIAANLSGAILDRAALVNCSLNSAGFSGASMDRCLISFADATRSNFAGAKITNAWIDHSSFMFADMNHVEMRHTRIRHTNFADTNFRNAKLGMSNWAFVELSNALMIDACLDLASFKHVDMTNIDLARASCEPLGLKHVSIDMFGNPGGIATPEIIRSLTSLDPTDEDA